MRPTEAVENRSMQTEITLIFDMEDTDLHSLSHDSLLSRQMSERSLLFPGLAATLRVARQMADNNSVGWDCQVTENSVT